MHLRGNVVEQPSGGCGMHPVEVVALAAVSALAILFSWGIVPVVAP